VNIRMYDVKGGRAIITGGAQGFGKEFARRLLQEGCKVCISDVDVSTGKDTKSEFQKQFGLAEDGVCFVLCDVSVKEDWNELWDSAEKFLGGPIDILANNAGIHPGVHLDNTT
jgi:NAD(P)-dependent dehydrogenase (short-subunit alcohol dehydrogenase family)